MSEPRDRWVEIERMLRQPVADVPDSLVPTRAACRDLLAALATAEREREEALDFIDCEGYRRCDIPACNCNRWHGGNAKNRLREISDTLADAGIPGGTTIHGGVLILRERAEKAEAALATAREENGLLKRSLEVLAKTLGERSPMPDQPTPAPWTVEQVRDISRRFQFLADHSDFEHDIVDALGAFANLLAASAWRPIADVPKGRVVIMFGVTDRHEDGRVANWQMATGHADFTTGELTWDGMRLNKPYHHLPTHWMPLPAAPRTRERQIEEKK
jgi:hypothetical protein